MQVNEYDTNLDYSGSLSYKTESGDEYWAYLAQIQKIYNVTRRKFYFKYNNTSNRGRFL